MIFEEIIVNYVLYRLNILYFTSCLLGRENTLEMQQYEISKEYITNAFMNYTNIQTQQRISIYLYYFGHAQNITQL